ncbi:MAG: hypothetical protein FGM47_04795 [Candidatus Nanopelagicaceae bacterium]|nr:hypothetical protein [Candidatus Nanopelagicaceae bacterium]
MKLYDELGGPFDLIMGLPVHPLVVHSAVVLVPLVAFSALAMSYWPSFSRKYGKPILILAVIAQISLFVAKASGESFEERLNKNVERHADLGEIAPITFIPLLVLLFIRWRMDRSGATVGSPRVRRMISILLALAAVLALVYIYLTGHSGAESVWGWLAKN